MTPLTRADAILSRASRSARITLFLLVGWLILSVPSAFATPMPQQQAQPAGQQVPDINITLGEGTQATDISLPMQILLLMTVLSLAPSIMVMLTSFTRIVIVFHFLRTALGTQSMPPNQILIGMALFLTLMIMWPVGQQIYDEAIAPYNAGELDAFSAFQKAEQPIRGFMKNFIREKDLALFLEINNLTAANYDEVPTYIVIPAFMLSEVKTAFEIGFLLFLPFLVIDMVVASVLLSMGMIMLPPILISMPFKLLIFILVDGWYLVIGSLVKSFKVV
jgi:flagellar biosynthetic protein FliP